MDGRGGEPDDNVVRLPAEWVGPLDELVPMGSRARERDPEGGDALGREAAVPAAGDFWSGDAGAVHGAIRPSGGLTSAPVSEDPLRAHRVRSRRLGSISRRPWGFTVRAAASMPRGRRVWPRPRAMAATGVAACVLGMAAIGLAEGGGRRGAGAAHRSGTAFAMSGSSQADRSGLVTGGLRRIGSSELSPGARRFGRTATSGAATRGRTTSAATRARARR